jgi:hypothetical protein
MVAHEAHDETVGADFWQGLDRELHDLCQPLTALQCRLELGQMIGDYDALAEAVEGAMLETERMFAAIAQMRERLTKETGAKH